MINVIDFKGYKNSRKPPLAATSEDYEEVFLETFGTMLRLFAVTGNDEDIVGWSAYPGRVEEGVDQDYTLGDAAASMWLELYKSRIFENTGDILISFMSCYVEQKGGMCTD